MTSKDRIRLSSNICPESEDFLAHTQTPVLAEKSFLEGVGRWYTTRSLTVCIQTLFVPNKSLEGVYKNAVLYRPLNGRTSVSPHNKSHTISPCAGSGKSSVLRSTNLRLPLFRDPAALQNDPTTAPHAPTKRDMPAEQGRRRPKARGGAPGSPRTLVASSCCGRSLRAKRARARPRST